jgi:hypothetical protein
MINPEAYQTDKKEFVRDDYGHVRPVITERNDLAKEVVRTFEGVKNIVGEIVPGTVKEVMKEAEEFRNNVAKVIGYKKKFSWEK